MEEILCVMKGKVQRVGYRDYVLQAAAECDVTGWVKNESDGSVVACAQGTVNNLKNFVEYLHEGSVMSVVESVSVSWRSAEEVYDDFSLRR